MVKIKQFYCFFSFFFVVGWICSRDTLYFVGLLLSIYLLYCSIWIAATFIVNPAYKPNSGLALASSSFGNGVRSLTFGAFY